MHTFHDPELAELASLATDLNASMVVVAGTHAPGDWVPALPPASISAGAFTPGTPVQNLAGYNALFVINFVCSAVTGATVTAGVGPTSATATSNTITYINTVTLAGVGIVPVIIPVPANYFVNVNSTGTFTVTNSTATWIILP